MKIGKESEKTWDKVMLKRLYNYEVKIVTVTGMKSVYIKRFITKTSQLGHLGTINHMPSPGAAITKKISPPPKILQEINYGKKRKGCAELT